MQTTTSLFIVGLAVATTAFSCPIAGAEQSATASNRTPLVFSGGHGTDPRDHGRPVTLIAGALGVAPEVFREAFSHVRPAPAGREPDPQQVRRNKDALLRALGKYGVTNDRLDEVSNYYRYVRSRGESWPTRAASGYAVLENGNVIRVVITSGGSGYTTPPTVTVSGMKSAILKAELGFNKDFAKNGSVTAVRLEKKPADISRKD